MEESNKTAFCSNCKHEIAVQNFQTHSAYCLRKIILCDVCCEPVQVESFKAHLEEEHVAVACSQCGEAVEKFLLPKHIELCPRRLVACEYCEAAFPLNTLGEHIDFCGSRTEKCLLCQNYVMIKNFKEHNQMHSFEKSEAKLYRDLETLQNVRNETICQSHTPLPSTKSYKNSVEQEGEDMQKKPKQSFESGSATGASACGQSEAFSKQYGRCPICKEYIPWVDMNTHMPVCASGAEKCAACGEDVSDENMKEHFMKKCPKLKRSVKAVPGKKETVTRSHSEKNEESRLKFFEQDSHQDRSDYKYFAAANAPSHNKSLDPSNKYTTCPKCQEKVLLAEMDKHTTSCIFPDAEKCFQCAQFVARGSLKEHVYDTCPALPRGKSEKKRVFEPADYEEYRSYELTDASDVKVCPFCFQKCSNDRILDHTRNCPRNIYECPLCLEKVPEKDKTYHDNHACKTLVDIQQEKQNISPSYASACARTLPYNGSHARGTSKFMVDETALCPKCKKRVSFRELETHLLACIENTITCKFCREEFQVCDEKNHVKECSGLGNKKKTKPKKPSKPNQNNKGAVPKRSNPMEELKKCHFCKNSYASSVLTFHEAACLHKTVVCEICGEIVVLKDFEDHGIRHHQYGNINSKKGKMGNEKEKEKKGVIKTILSFVSKSMPSFDAEEKSEAPPYSDTWQHSDYRHHNDYPSTPNHSTNTKDFYQTSQVYPDISSRDLIPCEFCGKKFTMDEIILHSTGCDPDSVSYKKPTTGEANITPVLRQNTFFDKVSTSEKSFKGQHRMENRDSTTKPGEFLQQFQYDENEVFTDASERFSSMQSVWNNATIASEAENIRQKIYGQNASLSSTNQNAENETENLIQSSSTSDEEEEHSVASHAKHDINRKGNKHAKSVRNIPVNLKGQFSAQNMELSSESDEGSHGSCDATESESIRIAKEKVPENDFVTFASNLKPFKSRKDAEPEEDMDVDLQPDFGDYPESDSVLNPNICEQQFSYMESKPKLNYRGKIELDVTSSSLHSNPYKEHFNKSSKPSFSDQENDQSVATSSHSQIESVYEGYLNEDFELNSRYNLTDLNATTQSKPNAYEEFLKKDSETRFRNKNTDFSATAQSKPNTHLEYLKKESETRFPNEKHNPNAQSKPASCEEYLQNGSETKFRDGMSNLKAQSNLNSSEKCLKKGSVTRFGDDKFGFNEHPKSNLYEACSKKDSETRFRHDNTDFNATNCTSQSKLNTCEKNLNKDSETRRSNQDKSDQSYTNPSSSKAKPYQFKENHMTELKNDKNNFEAATNFNLKLKPCMQNHYQNDVANPRISDTDYLDTTAVRHQDLRNDKGNRFSNCENGIEGVNGEVKENLRKSDNILENNTFHPQIDTPESVTRSSRLKTNWIEKNLREETSRYSDDNSTRSDRSVNCVPDSNTNENQDDEDATEHLVKEINLQEDHTIKVRTDSYGLYKNLLSKERMNKEENISRMDLKSRSEKEKYMEKEKMKQSLRDSKQDFETNLPSPFSDSQFAPENQENKAQRNISKNTETSLRDKNTSTVTSNRQYSKLQYDPNRKIIEGQIKTDDLHIAGKRIEIHRDDKFEQTRKMNETSSATKVDSFKMPSPIDKLLEAREKFLTEFENDCLKSISGIHKTFQRMKYDKIQNGESINFENPHTTQSMGSASGHSNLNIASSGSEACRSRKSSDEGLFQTHKAFSSETSKEPASKSNQNECDFNKFGDSNKYEIQVLKSQLSNFKNDDNVCVQNDDEYNSYYTKNPFRTKPGSFSSQGTNFTESGKKPYDRPIEVKSSFKKENDSDIKYSEFKSQLCNFKFGASSVQNDNTKGYSTENLNKSTHYTSHLKSAFKLEPDSTLSSKAIKNYSLGNSSDEEIEIRTTNRNTSAHKEGISEKGYVVVERPSNKRDENLTDDRRDINENSAFRIEPAQTVPKKDSHPIPSVEDIIQQMSVSLESAKLALNSVSGDPKRALEHMSTTDRKFIEKYLKYRSTRQLESDSD